MTSMKRFNEESVNQENIISKFSKLSTHVGPVNKNQRRAALSEIGNNLPHYQKIIFGNGTLPLPQTGIQQSKSSLLPFKQTKKIPDSRKRHERVSKFVAVDESETIAGECRGSGACSEIVESEYILENLNHLRSLEKKYAIQAGFLEGQETTPKMRAVLIKWLIQVHARFELNVESLHICVAITDRYLQENKNVGPNFLQLVGTTALLVACKYEETCVPAIDDLVSMCESAFSKKHFLTMEIEIMKKLNHSFGRPTSVQFLRRYNKIAQVSADHDSLGKFILEMALVEYEMSHIEPSLKAAAACCLSLGILDEVMDISILWTPNLIHYTKYEYDDLKEVVVSLAMLISSRSSKFQFIRTKYGSSTYDYISSSSKVNGPLVRKLTMTTTPTKTLD